MRTLILIAKAPRAGAAKTRLSRSPGIGAGEAAQLADAFLRDTLQHCTRVPDSELLICYTPPDETSYFRSLCAGARLMPQVDGELGARLRSAFHSAFDGGANRAVIIGGDTPHVDSRLLSRSFELLDQHPGVIGPSTDGGYYLLGLRTPTDQLFERIEWSTPRVFEQTLERALGASLALARLPEMFDVDESEDLFRLGQLLGNGDSGLCPHTQRVLRELGFVQDS